MLSTLKRSIVSLLTFVATAQSFVDGLKDNSPDRVRPGHIVDANFFDERWRIK